MPPDPTGTPRPASTPPAFTPPPPAPSVVAKKDCGWCCRILAAMALLALLLLGFIAWQLWDAKKCLECSSARLSSSGVSTSTPAASAAPTKPAASKPTPRKPATASREVTPSPIRERVVDLAPREVTPVASVPAASAPTQAPAPAVVASAPAATVCPKEVVIYAWAPDADKVPGVSDAIASTNGNHRSSDSVSRRFSATFVAMNNRGELPMSDKTYVITVRHFGSDGKAKATLYKGSLLGSYTFLLPPMVDGDYIDVHFPITGSALVQSPRQGELRAFAKEFTRCSSWFSAIEAR